MIRDGEVEVVLQDEKNQEYVSSNLSKDEFFGEAELLRGGKSIANVRAGSKPVDVLTLPRADFLRVVQESPITAEALGKIIQKRLDEQQVADHGSEASS
jgi:CRP-like cAMP-binding protein